MSFVEVRRIVCHLPKYVVGDFSKYVLCHFWGRVRLISSVITLSASSVISLLSLLQGPPSRRRVGWMDLLLQAHDAGATCFNDLEPDDLEVEELDEVDEEGNPDVRLLPGSISLLLDLRDRLPVPCDSSSVM